MKRLMKKLEFWGKRFLENLIGLFLSSNQIGLPPEQIHRVLVYRLDQRIGNGILLLPLLNAIRRTRPDIELHLFIHQPVAELYREFAPDLVHHLWPYRQRYLLSLPWRLVQLLFRLRRQRYDLIISSHNPDSFSLSQALMGRFLKPRALVGFRWKNSEKFYHIAIPSSAEKHYAAAQLDLWRHFYPQAPLEWGGFHVPEQTIREAFAQWGISLPHKSALLWLGATGDKVLPISLISFLYEQIRKQTGLEVIPALGPADEAIYQQLPDGLREKTLVWSRPLRETAIFFALFSLFISADTGPMHLAVALGLSTLTIFRHSNPVQYGYQEPNRHISLMYRGRAADREAIVQALSQLGNALNAH